MASGSDSFGTRLRALRSQAGLSQVELARAVGRHQTAIGPYERDEYSPSGEVVSRFARILDTTPEFLLFGREPNRTALAVGGQIGPGGVVRVEAERNQRRWVEILDSSLMAFEIADDCMAPVFPSGTLVLVTAGSDPELQAHMGDVGLIELDDGRQLLRRLMPDALDGHFALSAYNGTTLLGVQCVAIRPVMGTLYDQAYTRVGRGAN